MPEANSIFAVIVNPYAEGVRARVREITVDEPEDWHLFIGQNERVLGEFPTRDEAHNAGLEYLRQIDCADEGVVDEGIIATLPTFDVTPCVVEVLAIENLWGYFDE
jgi:hypothetical protein